MRLTLSTQKFVAIRRNVTLKELPAAQEHFLCDEETLERLLALNLERAAA